MDAARLLAQAIDMAEAQAGLVSLSVASDVYNNGTDLLCFQPSWVHNYGQTISIWDWVFGTRYLPNDKAPPEDIGIADLEAFPMTWWSQLLSPFRWASIKQASISKPSS